MELDDMQKILAILEKISELKDKFAEEEDSDDDTCGDDDCNECHREDSNKELQEKTKKLTKEMFNWAIGGADKDLTVKELTSKFAKLHPNIELFIPDTKHFKAYPTETQSLITFQLTYHWMKSKEKKA